MKSVKKSIIYGTLGIGLMMLFCILPAVKTKAAEPVIATKKSVGYRDFKHGIQSVSIRIKNLISKSKITNLKIDRSSIALSKVKGKGKYQRVVLYFKKAGTVKVSFQIAQEGKTYHLTKSYTMKQLTSPCASFKIGNKEYNKKIWNSPQGSYSILSPKEKVKISITPKKGWKLKAIDLYAYRYSFNNDYNYGYGYDYYVSKKIKNHKTINLKGTDGSITAIFINKKTGRRAYIRLEFIG